MPPREQNTSLLTFQCRVGLGFGRALTTFSSHVPSKRGDGRAPNIERKGGGVKLAKAAGSEYKTVSFC